MNRREVYHAPVPEGGKLLFAGADVQKDRIENEVIAVGKDWETWSVDYEILLGDTTKPDVWDEYYELLKSQWRHESGRMLSLTAAAVDAGYMQTEVLARVADFNAEWLYPVKGMSGSRPIVEPNIVKRLNARRRRRNIKLEIIGVEELKRLMTQRFQVSEPGPGYCHFPMERDQEYFEQLTADKVVTYYQHGRPVRRVETLRPRNEASDCRGYAIVAGLLHLRQENVPLVSALERFSDHKQVSKKPGSSRHNWISTKSLWMDRL